MDTICLYFEIHQPFQLRRYRFFDIGKDHYYYDDKKNEETIHHLAEKCYLPATQMFLDLIKESFGAFHLSFSISGVTLELLEHYAPEVIDRFKELAATGCVEFLAETYSHSLVSLRNDGEFELQVKEHVNKIKSLFNYEPKVFRNTSLVYSNAIGQRVYKMGFKGILTEGDKRFMGWHSPNYVYCNFSDPRLKILTRNSDLSNDITFRFSNWSWDQYPLTADKYMKWIVSADKKEQVTCLFMDLETLGEKQKEETGIFDFFYSLPKFAKESGLKFKTPSEVFAEYKPIDQLRFDNPISWGDEEKDVSAWLGNELQSEAFNKISDLSEKVRLTQDARLLQDWYRMQSNDHFFYMCTKHFANGSIHNSPYDSPYDAFMNYMNVLNDFRTRVHEQNLDDDNFIDLSKLKELVSTQEEQITHLKDELQKVESPKEKTVQKSSNKKSKK